jgi:glyoxylase-like metal-dependent hydrolase (beta-lactamase superfamily II)
MDEVVPGIFALSGLRVGRSYLIEDRDGLTLIDTSSPGVADRILRAIASVGRRPDDLNTIVATHYHYDHTGNVAALVEATGAKLYVHADDAPYVDGRARWMPVRGIMGALGTRFATAQFNLRIDRELRDGDTLPAAGGLRVVHAPGHTPGHIALHAPDRRVLFAGDAFGNWLGLRRPMASSSHDMPQAERSIRLLAQLDFDHALPGHGRPILNHAGEKIAEWAKKWVMD